MRNSLDVMNRRAKAIRGRSDQSSSGCSNIPRSIRPEPAPTVPNCSTRRLPSFRRAGVATTPIMVPGKESATCCSTSRNAAATSAASSMASKAGSLRRLAAIGVQACRVARPDTASRISRGAALTRNRGDRSPGAAMGHDAWIRGQRRSRTFVLLGIVPCGIADPSDQPRRWGRPKGKNVSTWSSPTGARRFPGLSQRRRGCEGASRNCSLRCDVPEFDLAEGHTRQIVRRAQGVDCGFLGSSPEPCPRSMTETMRNLFFFLRAPRPVAYCSPKL